MVQLLPILTLVFSVFIWAILLCKGCQVLYVCVLFCFLVFFSPLLQTVVPKASFQQITGREQLCYTATLTQKQVFYEWVSTRFPKKRALCDTWGSDPFPLPSLWRGSLLRAQSGMPLDHLGCTWAPACRDSGAQPHRPIIWPWWDSNLQRSL